LQEYENPQHLKKLLHLLKNYNIYYRGLKHVARENILCGPRCFLGIFSN